MNISSVWRSVILVVVIAAFLFAAGAVYIFDFTTSRTFVNHNISAGDYTLNAYISEGKSAQETWLIFVHGNRRAGQEHELYVRLLSNITPKISVLAIDLRGFGRSPPSGLSREEQILDRSIDIDVAASYLKEKYQANTENIILMGHSFGSLMILKAAKRNPYKLLVPIGPSDFNVFLNHTERRDSYINKFAGNTTVTIPVKQFIREGTELTPAALFDPCPSAPIVMIFGEHDYSDTLINKKETIPSACMYNIDWRIIPLSDHMYNAEKTGLLSKLKKYASIGLLRNNINSIVTTNLNGR